MTTGQPIAADFPFEAHFVEVHSARMHYVDGGSGDKIHFIEQLSVVYLLFISLQFHWWTELTPQDTNSHTGHRRRQDRVRDVHR